MMSDHAVSPKCFLAGSIVTVVLFISVSADAVGQQVVAKTLYTDMFTDYDSSLIPICSQGSNVTLNMDIALRQIMQLVGSRRCCFKCNK